MKRDSGCTQIIVALIGAIGVIVAAVLGGPLIEDWLDRNDTNTNGGGSSQGGAIQVSASANPNTVSVGQPTEISVLALGEAGDPLAAANVIIQVGGGLFEPTGTTTISGKTNNEGIFRTSWRCDACAAEYVFEVRVNKSNFSEGRREFSVFIP